MADSHEISPKSYYIVFAVLIVLTLVTVQASHVKLGAMNTPLAMAIAVVEAALVVLIFMHALHSPRLTWIVIGGSVFCLIIMFVLTLSDYMSRAY